ncbi:MAG: hypothetical protein EBU07_14005, partial [Betaproteobacteria bacterium]|nr:hypothetical protein [Betaproteobacteria bacterium]
MMWIAANGHRLLRRRGSLKLPDLEEFLCVLPPPTARIRNLIDAEFRQQGAQMPVRLIETLSYPTMLGCVLEHKALALTTRQQARSIEAMGLAAPLNLPMRQVVMSIAATTLSGEDNTVAKAFVGALRQVAASQA